MNKTKLLCAASAAMTLTFAGAATTYEVHDVDELTNACAKATTNFDTIKIYPGTYDLTGIKMASETLNKETHYIHLNFKANYMKILGMGATPDETIIKGGGAVDKQRLMVFINGTSIKNYCTVSNLTFTGGYVDTVAGSGGVCSGNAAGTFIDCVFTNNYAANFGGALDGATSIIHCRFINNSAGNKGGVLRPQTSSSKAPTLVRDSYLEGNYATGVNGGVSYYGCTWSNCVFVGNHAPEGGVFGGTDGHKTIAMDCHFTNNYVTGTATTPGIISTFAVNSTTHAVTANLIAATNCTFFGNGTAGVSLFGGCDVVNCSFNCNTGGIQIVHSTVRNSRFVGNVGTHKNTNPLFGSSTFYNCLFARNRAGDHDMSTLTGTYSTIPSYLYNCTVVSNEYRAANYSIVQDGTCVNTILADNCLYDKTWVTVSRQDIGRSTYLPPTMTNCLWTAQLQTPSAEKAIGGGLVTGAQLRFTDAANGDYTIPRKSVARNAGWSDAAYLEAVGATDLKGDARVFEGVIDVGCYECVLSPLGLAILVR